MVPLSCVLLYVSEYVRRAVPRSTCVPSPADERMLSGRLAYMPGILPLAILLSARLEELY